MLINDSPLLGWAHHTPKHSPTVFLGRAPREFGDAYSWTGLEPVLNEPTLNSAAIPKEEIYLQLPDSIKELVLVSDEDAEGCRRLALADRGLALLSRRDRTSVGTARKRWGVSPLHAKAALTWRNVSGKRSGQLLRNVEHTAAVHWFVAVLSRQARSRGWQVVQLDPPRRASRYFRHEERLNSVRPDAFGIVGQGEQAWPFFLEWERRAVRPVTMTARLAPYLRYYASHRPIDDHGAQPSVLVVFDDDLAETHFLRVAREEMARTRVHLPLWVSHTSLLERVGPLGPAWRTPDGSETTHAFPGR